MLRQVLVYHAVLYFNVVHVGVTQKELRFHLFNQTVNMSYLFTRFSQLTEK